MICEKGVPFLYSPDGEIVACVDSHVALDWAVVAERIGYFSDRVADWVPPLTVTAGVLILLLAVIAVGSLLR